MDDPDMPDLQGQITSMSVPVRWDQSGCICSPFHRLPFSFPWNKRPSSSYHGIFQYTCDRKRPGLMRNNQQFIIKNVNAATLRTKKLIFLIFIGFL